MDFEISKEDKKLAQVPHTLFVLNVLLFNLLMAPAGIVLDVGMYGFLLPLLCSLTIIAFIYLRGRKQSRWFVEMHWRLSFRRCQFLLLGYSISAMLGGVSWLISINANDAKMAEIMFMAISRVSVVPTLLAVMVTVVLEAGAQHLVNSGTVPDRLVEKFPAPAYLAD
ncbi:MAG: ABC-type Fe3+-siderophore transport system permease subunit [Motiliproteus sp.]|jgi:ABC-type Fe3+-siderophore transport system permease subunit